jgi:hypothetical protein
MFLSFSAFSQEAKLFEKFEIGATCEGVKRRLDNFAQELKNQPNAKGYIVYYGGRYYPILKSNRKLKNSLPRAGESKTRTKLYESYLLINKAIETARLYLLDGGFREEYEVELWIVPVNAKLPELKPTVKTEDIKFRKGKISKKELAAIFNCEN